MEQNGASAFQPHGRTPLFDRFSRAEWTTLGQKVDWTPTQRDLQELGGLNEPASDAEIRTIYSPLVALLELHRRAASGLARERFEFLHKPVRTGPFIVGLAGSVAVGKSTTARILQTLLARTTPARQVALVPTDGFLYPNAVLRERSLLERKGFPESYDLTKLIDFLSAVKSNSSPLGAPVYSHLQYDVLPDQLVDIGRPDVLILEGLNILQVPTPPRPTPRVFVSDFLDFSIYVDAEESLIRDWYIERFLMLCSTAFRSPESYFHKYASLSEPDAREVAARVWESINGRNLRENILPTRERADVILAKGSDHSVQEILLRRR